MSPNRPTTSEALSSLIGEAPEGSHPDEWFPRAATWHHERANWQREVELYRAHMKMTAALTASGEGEPAGRTPPDGEAFKALGRLYNHNADPDGVRAEYDRMTVFNALRGNAYDARYSFLMEYLNDVGTAQDILIRDTDRSDSTHIITRERKTYYMDEGERENVWEAIERDLIEHGTEEAKAEYKAISVPAPILRSALSSSPSAPALSVPPASGAALDRDELIGMLARLSSIPSKCITTADAILAKLRAPGADAGREGDTKLLDRLEQRWMGCERGAEASEVVFGFHGWTSLRDAIKEAEL